MEQKRTAFLIGIALVILTVIAYGQVAGHEFIHFDDDTYVFKNPRMESGLTLENIGWAFSTGYAGNWHPLTWMSHLVDFRFFGSNPSGHHLVNLVFHVANALLLFSLFLRLTGALWRSALVAFLFALHPLHVETVAWVSERKDVLCGFFWMLSLHAYRRYVVDRSRKYYALVFLCFSLGLLSKPMIVTLPFTLLLMDFWPLGRMNTAAAKDGSGGLIVEKIPFFTLSLASSLVTYVVQQRGGSVAPLDFLPIGQRLLNATANYVTYLVKTAVPVHLAFLYPLSGSVGSWRVLGSALLLALVTAAVLRYARKRPFMVFGWFWYTGTLVPVIGIVQAGNQAVADRYTYIPLIGIFTLLAWGASELLPRRRSGRVAAAIAAGALVSVLTVLTWRQTGYWKDSVSLFEHALTVTENNFIVHNNLGNVYFRNGDLDRAIEQFRKAIEVRPTLFSLNNIGMALVRTGEAHRAIPYFKAALEMDPSHRRVRENLDRAVGQAESTAEFHDELGVALFNKGELEKALSSFRRSIEIDKGFWRAYNGMGIVMTEQKRFDEALRHFSMCLELRPEFVEAYNNTGVVLVRQGRLEEAAAAFSEALRIQPEYMRARRNLEAVERKMGSGEGFRKEGAR